jgi:PhoPQ-activated pathogenicity-related protein
MSRFFNQLSALVFVLVISIGSAAFAGPLQDFVDTPDPNYTYTLAKEVRSTGYTRYVLDLTAQSWKEGEVTPHLWKHWVTIICPDEVEYDTALLFISGGNNSHLAPPSGVEDFIPMLAKQTKSIIVSLQGIPNEPVQFIDEDRTRTEDEIIAYSYNKFMETSDPTWPLLCPMVKSTVRAMDSVQDFMSTKAPKTHTLNSFVLAGASKRGWTTWLTATVDKRVIGIAPVVIDMLNLDEHVKQTMDYYGYYTEATQDYTEYGIQDKIDTPEGQALLKIVDPYEYRDILTMPKLILLGSGDQYWTVDAANLYYDGLLEPKYIRYEPNADHGIDDSLPSVFALANFYLAVMNGRELAKFDWEFGDDGSYTVISQMPPKQVKLWKATAPTMDFRLKTIGDAWSSVPLVDSGNHVYTGKVEIPKDGFVAYYVELSFGSASGIDYSLTTQISVPGRNESGAAPMSPLVLWTPVVLIGLGLLFLLKKSFG